MKNKISLIVMITLCIASNSHSLKAKEEKVNNKMEEFIGLWEP